MERDIQHQGDTPDKPCWTIRVATPADAAQVDRLLKASYPVLMAGAYEAAELAPALERIAHVNPELLSCRSFYVAELESGQVVGCGGWTQERPGTREIEAHTGHVRHFATHPDWSRRGVGRSVFRYTAAEARSADIRSMVCFSSLNAEPFYLSLGFRRISQFAIDLGAGVSLPAVEMSRTL